MTYHRKKSLLEVDVGVTNYIGNIKGFTGTLKHRFSDFHVNEVRLDGSLVKLTDESVPDEDVESSDVDYKIDAVSAEALLQLVELAMHGGQEVTIDVTHKSKQERRDIHDLIRKKFPSKLVSNTKEKNDKKLLIVTKSNKSVKDRRPVWPARRKGDYVHFVMHKENKDTMEVVNLIAYKLNMKPNNITFAGTKDRRAKTSQMLSVRKVEPLRLASINKYLNDISLGNYVFESTPLKLGDLKGNNFRIAVRNVTASEEEVDLALNSLKKDGFINYYGLQRFGSTFTVPTYNIGRALLLGDWVKAVDLILAPRENEARVDVKAARTMWQETRNAEAAYGKLGKGKNTVEGKLLQGLVKNGSDIMGALNFIPRNMRLLYLHSYQSLIWNKIASQRINEFGLKPVVGDLVLKKSEDRTSCSSENNLQQEMSDAVVADEDGCCCEEEEFIANDSGNKQVCVLSEELVKEASIEDVVLPLPGHSVLYPKNVVAEWYEELLKADGLTSASMKQKAKSYSLGGTYRRLVERPQNVSWKTLRYSSPDDILILSDVEQLRLVETPRDNLEGKYRGVVIEFMLPPSCYATMALRQAMRQDTSSGFHAALSQNVVANHNVLANPDIAASSAATASLDIAANSAVTASHGVSASTATASLDIAASREAAASHGVSASSTATASLDVAASSDTTTSLDVAASREAAASHGVSASSAATASLDVAASSDTTTSLDVATSREAAASHGVSASSAATSSLDVAASSEDTASLDAASSDATASLDTASSATTGSLGIANSNDVTMRDDNSTLSHDVRDKRKCDCDQSHPKRIKCVE